MRNVLIITLSITLATIHGPGDADESCEAGCASAETCTLHQSASLSTDVESSNAVAACSTATVCDATTGALSVATDFAGALGFQKPDIWITDDLRNKVDPFNEMSTKPELYIRYDDEESQIFGRIHFSSESSLLKAEKMSDDELKELFRRTYFSRADGSLLPYKTVRLIIDNAYCPVSGVGKPAGPDLNFDTAMAGKCTGTTCTVNNGFKANYNGIQLSTCYLTCRAVLVGEPQMFLSNIQPFIRVALEPESGIVATK